MADRHAAEGTVVVVRSRFEGSWSTGFEVVEVLEAVDGPWLRIRRQSDGVVLPVLFRLDEVDPV